MIGVGVNFFLLSDCIRCQSFELYKNATQSCIVHLIWLVTMVSLAEGLRETAVQTDANRANFMPKATYT